jgi:alkylation response protein AidB-like acyl-CoA dehydrogenase
LSAHPLASAVADTFASDFACALAVIAGGADEHDRDPRYPGEAFAALRAAGVPQLAGQRERCDLRTEVELVRAVAGVDASCARILDGHFNGVERLALSATDPLREDELAAVRAGELLLGVWGADPAPGEGPPARVEKDSAGDLVLRGVKTFCSGAGGVQRALVIARDSSDARRLAYVDVTDRVHVDRGWYRASGLRSSESHRVEFTGTTVLALLGGADELMREPWFSRDAVRTASTWAGIVDCIFDATLTAVGERKLDAIALHALGEMRLAAATIDRWLEHTVSALNDPAVPLYADDGTRALASECRLALAQAARLIASQSARVGGSRALVGGGTLDRARRDLDLFLLQHRLDPKLVELGELALEERCS